MRYVHHDFSGFQRWRKGSARKEELMGEIERLYGEFVVGKERLVKEEMEKERAGKAWGGLASWWERRGVEG